MRTPAFWAKNHHPLRYALMPLSLIYSAAGQLQQIFTTPQNIGKPVICVGNVSLGGAGKTPITLMLAHQLTEMGEVPAILSRGYGGSQKTALRVDPSQHDAAHVGDEPLMMAADFKVFVGHDRRATARLALQQGASVLLMDDGFQNPSLHRDYNLLVVDKSLGFGNGTIFPAGPLRQTPRRALCRADGVILTGATPKEPRKDIDNLTKIVSAKGLDLLQAEVTPIGDLPKAAIAFCGIGYPEKFFSMLRTHGVQLVECHSFGDHQPYAEGDAKKLLAVTQQHKVPLLTTRKDLARLTAMPKDSSRARLAATAHAIDITTSVTNPKHLETILTNILVKAHQ